MHTRLAAFMVALACLMEAGACPASAQSYGRDTVRSFTPVVQNASYSSGNAMGGLQTVPFFNPSPALSGIFDNFAITAKDGAVTAMTIYVYAANPTGTTCTDKSAFSEGAADIAKRAMAPFVLTPAVIGVGTTASTAQQTVAISVQNLDAPSTTNLYFCIVAGGTVTPGSTSNLVASVNGALD